MQIKPVTKADKPEYPTASEIDIPKVLNASKPKKWKRNATIGAVMVGIVVIPAITRTQENSKQATNIIAPLFEHGDGIGSIGCVVINPAKYITEKEAFEIIQSELIKSDIKWNLISDSTKYIMVNTKYFEKVKKKNSEANNKDSFYIATRINKLYFNYVDSVSQLGFVYISEQNCFTYQDDSDPWDWSVSIVETKNIAYKIVNQAQSQKQSMVVFYDPYKMPNQRVYFKKNTNIDSTFAALKEEQFIFYKNSKDSLRAQVRDFLAWYKENKGKK